MRYLCVACCLNWGMKSRSPQAKGGWSSLILMPHPSAWSVAYFFFTCMLHKVLVRKEFN